jgi:hypothetical protein
MSDTEKTRLDALILANHVEACNGLLYISGGGWTDLHRQLPGGAAPVTHLGIGISVRVPWHQTNEPHSFTLDIQNEDSTVTIAHAEGNIVVGRPPQLVPGALQHAVIAINIDTVFPSPGGYRVVATIDGEESSSTWPFRVHDTTVPIPRPGSAN